MILPKTKATIPAPKTITLADGQTFTVLVSTPSFQQRFADEGREVLAYSGRDNEAWPAYRLGRIREAIIDWQDVTNENGQPIPFTAARLFALMEAAPETVTQLTAIANEAFRPLVVVPKSPEPPANSGATVETDAALPRNSASTPVSAEQDGLPASSESQPAS